MMFSPPLPPPSSQKSVPIEDIDNDDELYRSNTDLWKDVIAETNAAAAIASATSYTDGPATGGVAEEKEVSVAAGEAVTGSHLLQQASKIASSTQDTVTTAAREMVVSALASTKILIEEEEAVLDLEELD